ncbi:MAG: M56 family metallopeptidase [Bacteroidales bacterium]|nr:M56 family metallopeptidase [Bacteroidales bacterium]
MDSLFIYLLKSSLSLMILYLSYQLIFKKEAYFNFSRLVLLSILFVAIFLPIVPYNAATVISDSPEFLKRTNELNAPIYYFTLKEVVVKASDSGFQFFNQISYSQTVWIIYFLGVLAMSLSLGWKLFKIFRLIKFSDKKNYKGLHFVFTYAGAPTYSFFKWIFVDPELFENKENFEEIIEHEKIHAFQGHSIDLILAEIACIIQWFNPFAYLLQNTIKENHEFISDHKVINSKVDIKSYQLLLIEHSSLLKTNNLTHNFSYSLLERRLKMMKKSRSPIGFAIRLFVLATSFTLIFFACSSPENQSPNDLNKDTPAAEIATNPIFEGGMEALIDYISSELKYPDQAKLDGVEGKVMVSFTVEKDGSISNTKIIKGIGAGCDEEALRVCESMPNWIPGITSSGEKAKVSMTLPINFKLEPKEDPLFLVVETMPSFPGGEAAMYTYIGSKLSYPAQAKKDKIQGRVFITFVVEKDGSITGAEVLRGIGGGCDEEALRVIRTMPKWTPGMQGGEPVRVQYRMPIKFTLQ